MPISSDVNTIFAYVDGQHKFHVPVVIFISPYKRKDKYVLLDKVKSSFIYNYSSYLKDSGVFIEKAIINLKTKRSPLLPKPSPFTLSILIKSEIKKFVDEVSKKEFFNYDAVNRFINKMLTEYSIISLYEEPEKLAEFREKYIMNSEKESTNELNRFLQKFKSFDIINFADVNGFDKWMDMLKKIELQVFQNKQDYEDMKIAAEFLAYNEEIDVLSFFTCDGEFHRSLGAVATRFNQRIGKLYLLKSYVSKSNLLS